MRRTNTFMLALPFLIFVVLMINGCGKGDESELTVTGPTSAFFLPNDISFSTLADCYPGETISHPRFTLPNIQTEWTATDGSTYLPLVWEIKTSEAGGFATIDCNYSSSEGQIATFLGHSKEGMVKEDGRKTSICPIHCGGASIANPDSPFVVTATLIIRGIKTENNAAKTQKQVTGRYTFSIENTP